MDAILRALGFSPTFVYEKFRSEWSDGQGQVVLDHTPIGDIAEIEGKARWIDRTARTLGVDAKNYITKSYGELFFDWKRRTKCKAENMTFRECGKCTARPSSRGAATVGREGVVDSSGRSRAPALAKISAEACAGSGV